jgi:putative endonuclease
MADNKHIAIGRLGEDIVARYLENRGYSIRERNFKKKCGELDIVAHKDNVLHFVEVKAGSWSGSWPKEGKDVYRPEDHMHKNKLARLGRAMQTYLTEHPVLASERWTLDLVVVLINEETRRARVACLRDILCE